ncbi:MAG: ABC transporter ATP-binding protein [Nitrososphaerota archaeon]
MALLKGTSIIKAFEGVIAVNNVDFFVEEGEILGLIGPNGAGKTTLFNLISGALKPDRGEIIFLNRRISGLRPHAICRMGIARTFQDVKIFGNMRAIDNVIIGAMFGLGDGLSVSDAEKIAYEVIEFCGLKGSEQWLARDLPLASQKRLEVARALATRPRLILLDELMAGLNPAETTQAIELVKAIRENGCTVFIVEHVLRAIMNVCDRVMVLHYGEKIAEGTPKEVCSDSKVIEVYLGESYA